MSVVNLPLKEEPVDGRALQAHCARALAPYKVPKKFIFSRGPLPRTGSGKLLRRELHGG